MIVKYTEEERLFITKKIPNMHWNKIPRSLKEFWLEYRKTNI